MNEQVEQIEGETVLVSADERTKAAAALAAAQAKLAALDHDVAEAEQQIKDLTAKIAVAANQEEAKKWIAERAAGQALKDEFLSPKRPALVQAVADERTKIAYLVADERAVVLSGQRQANMAALISAGAELEAALDAATVLATEIKQRYNLLGSEMSEIQMLGQAGHVFPVSPTTGVRSLEEVIADLTKNDKTDWQISRSFKIRLDGLSGWIEKGGVK